VCDSKFISEATQPTVLCDVHKALFPSCPHDCQRSAETRALVVSNFFDVFFVADDYEVQK